MANEHSRLSVSTSADGSSMTWRLHKLEHLSVTKREILHSREEGSKKAAQTYAAEEICNLRWEPDVRPGSKVRLSGIEFYHGPDSILLFAGIGKTEAREVIRTIVDFIPLASQPYEAWHKAKRERTLAP